MKSESDSDLTNDEFLGHYPIHSLDKVLIDASSIDKAAGQGNSDSRINSFEVINLLWKPYLKMRCIVCIVVIRENKSHV